MEIYCMFWVWKKRSIRRACKQKEVNAGGVHPSRRGVQVVQEESADLEEERNSTNTLQQLRIQGVASIMNPFNCRCISMEY